MNKDNEIFKNLQHQVLDLKEEIKILINEIRELKSENNHLQTMLTIKNMEK